MSMPPYPPEFPEFPRGPGPDPARPVPGSGTPGLPPPSAADLLLRRRIVLADGLLDGPRATELSARLMMLDGPDDEPITLHLRTPDGELAASWAVADTIGILTCPVHALVTGQAGGSALVVLAAARRREMTPHAMLRLTEPPAGTGGGATDVASFEQEHRRRLDAFFIRLAEVTGREVDEIRQDARRGRLLTPDDALAYGLIDGIVSTAP